MRDHATAPPLDISLGERLISPEYKSDFRERDSHIVNGSSWKLERLQHFEELKGNASREALREGNWEEALRLIDARRDGLLRVREERAARGYVFHRVRVVEEPFTPYVQWELHSLRMQAEYGGTRVRVIDADAISSLEVSGPLPEVVILGGSTMYEVRYSDRGDPLGAVRYTDPATVARWEDFLRHLYTQGEDVHSYIDRKVAHLPPPHLAARKE